MDGGDFLVTAENPARKDGTLDYTSCAALYNKLVEHVWIVEGKSLDQLERRLFFQHYGQGANEIMGRLDLSLASFLELVIVSDELPPFFFWVACISPPAEMFTVPDMFQEQVKEPGRFLTLYTTNSGLGGHVLGLVYDQKLHRATVALGIEDLEFTEPIEERLAAEHQLPPNEGPLINDGQLDAASVPRNCFIRSFLTRARRPWFKMIAPGLEIPHDPTVFIDNQKFTVMNSTSEYDAIIPPVLIFASAERLVMDLDAPNRYISFNPFCKPFRDSVPRSDRWILAGLYSESIERFSFDNAEEGFRLLLPFRFCEFGQGHRVRKSDGGLLTEV